MRTRNILFRNAIPFIACAVMLAMFFAFLPGRPDYSAVWASDVSDGLVWVKGTEGSVMAVPEKTLQYEEVGSANRMVDIDTGYILRSKRAVAYALRNSFVFEEAVVEGDLTAEELVDELETVAHIRIQSSQKVGTAVRKDRKLTKNIYQCYADILFNTEYYGSYAGYMSIIQKGTTYKVMFAGTVDGSGAGTLYEAARSHAYREYALPEPNAGNEPEKGTLPAKTAKVNPGTKGKARVMLRGPEGQRATDMGLTLTDIYYIGPDDLMAELKNGGREGLALPVLEKGQSFAIAEFDVDALGQDVSVELPFIRVRVTDGDGNAMAPGEDTYIVSQKPKTLKIFFIAEDGRDIRLYAGQDGLRIDCHPRTERG